MRSKKENFSMTIGAFIILSLAALSPGTRLALGFQLDLAAETAEPTEFDLDQDFISVDKTVISILKDLKDENGENEILKIIKEKSPNIFSKINGIYSKKEHKLREPAIKTINKSESQQEQAKASKYSWIDSAVDEFLPKKKLSFDTIKTQFTDALEDEGAPDFENDSKIKEIVASYEREKQLKTLAFTVDKKNAQNLFKGSNNDSLRNPSASLFANKERINESLLGRTTKSSLLGAPGINENSGPRIPGGGKQEEIRSKIRKLLYD